MTSPTGADPLRDLLQARLGAQYEVDRLLGQGGMGSVYLARDRTLDRPVAIKVIGGDVTTNVQLRERFLLEARTVAKMRHPNLVAVYSAGDADGLLYFVMEYVPGESLRDLLSREGKVEKGRAERILHEMSLALDYAHQNGIVHRDVKPENILLDRDTGRAMLTDFGVARALEGDGRMTGTGLILGSPRYMSPEQASGETTLDGRSDLYSLALVGYEMFTGKPVVESGNIAGMLVKHLTETPRPLADAAAGVPEGAATAIDRALAKDRAARWASGREMAEVIGMAWTPAGIASGAGTRAYARPGSPAQRRRTMLVGAGVAALVAAVAVVAWAMGRDRADPRKSYAVVPFDVQTGNPEVQWLRDGAVNMLTLALGQWSDLSVADYERTLALVREQGLEARRVDLAAARDVAGKAGAGTVVMGLITTTADSMHVQATLYDVRSGEALPNRTTRSAALGADPRPLFDDLARYLLDVAGGSPSASVELARATTSSITAYRAYLDGVRLLNSWRLRQADSAFRVAIREDSTFALAWHKRSLALGWGDATGAEYIAVANRAAELAERLPPREQALVHGHRALAIALRSQQQADTATRARYREAKRIFSTLLGSDSMVAEAWYGLADAYFHDFAAQDSLPQAMDRMNNALRGFHRTLALDSTFHLAYSHLLQFYTGLSMPGNPLVISGDSVIFYGDSASLRRAGGLARVDELRRQSSLTGMALARGWVKADADAAQPYVTLANMYAAAGQIDSAVAVMDRGVARPSLAAQPNVRLLASVFQLLAGEPRAVRTMREATVDVPAARFREAGTNERFGALAGGMTVAAASGSMAEMRRMSDLFMRVDSTIPFTDQSMRPMLDWMELGAEIALTGKVTPDQRRRLRAGMQRADSATGGAALQTRQSSGAVMMAAYLATRDTAYSGAIRRWGNPNTRHTDLDALEALQRGDTAAARAIVAAYPPADSLRTSRFSMGGLRTIARAEAMLALGDTARALGYFEGLESDRFTLGFIEPSLGAYVRTFAARARIYEDRGESAKAIAAWEEYLRRFEYADGTVEAEKAEARAALRRLREVVR
jgi:tetratricopeptide (TPR) repeat protein/TolB-like protein/predicted Ser/Thr protein kinase